MKEISQQEMENTLIEITRQLLMESGENYQRDIKLTASLQRYLGIDSLGRAELFQRIEKKFHTRLPDRLLAEAETLKDIEEYLLSENAKTFVPVKREIVASHGETASVDPSHAASLIEVLLLYAEHFPNKAHIYFQNEEGGEQTITYQELLKNALRMANGLHQLGLMEGETVAIMQPTHPHFFYIFFGTLLAGGIPVPIYPPFRMHMLETYAKTESHILQNAKVRILVTFEKAERLSQLLKSFVPSLKHVVTPQELLQTEEFNSIFQAKNNHPAFIQYTSGSTSNPKGVLLTHANLLSNISAYGKAIRVTPDDIAVSWLPLYHDMGLIGMWLGSLYFGVPLILFTPFSFLNHPERWLWAIHYHRGTLSGAPNFAYELCVRKIDPSLMEGLDLSSWRMAANGAEKIYPKTLEQFANKFASCGFKKSALLPVYGLAESTVALTIPPLGREFLVDTVDRKQFEKERRAVSSQGKDALSFVSCGSPIQDHEVRIVDEENRLLPERTVGNLQFRGPSSMQGYYDNPEATQAIYHEGWWDSGDLAYMAGGEVYLTGRRKDLIIKAGRNLYPAEIEELVGGLEGVRQGCVTAFAVNDNKNGSEQLIVVAESREKSQAKREKIIADIKAAISDALDIVPDHVEVVAPHTVPKTSSGKLQRAACKTMYLENRLYKSQTPPWLQITKLGIQSFGKKISAGIYLFLKSIYTLYAVLLMGISFFPMYVFVKYTSRDRAAKAVKTWTKWILRLAFCRIKSVHTEAFKPHSQVIFAPNHCSYIDSVVMVSLLPYQTRFVVKKELFSLPLLGSSLKKLDYLGVDRIDLTKGLEDTKHIENILRSGHPILIFPEGTFSYAAGLRPFRLGAFKISTETGIPVCPVAINGTRYILRDDEKLMAPHPVTVTFGKTLHPQGREWEHVNQLRDAVRAEILRYCGEPSLDFIAAGPVAPKRTE